MFARQVTGVRAGNVSESVVAFEDRQH